MAPKALEYDSTRKSYAAGLTSLVSSGKSARLNAFIVQQMQDTLPDVANTEDMNKDSVITLDNMLKARFGKGLPKETMDRINKIKSNEVSGYKIMGVSQ
jgi:hypothetical protein